MEFLTDSLREVVSKLSEDQKEEIDVIESIISTKETNKEDTKEKVFRFLETEILIKNTLLSLLFIRIKC